MFKLISAILFLCGAYMLHAQPDIDYAVSVPSQSLKSQENIQVYLPQSYHEGNRKYPVLYILDGQWFFLNGVAIQETLRGDGLLSEMIVVGLDFKSRSYHDSLHFNHWDALSTYIQEELTAYVDQTYRTTFERVVFGWENPSFMVSEFLFKKDPVFTGFILSNGGYVTQEMLEQFNRYEGKRLYLYIANSKKDIYTIESSGELEETLTAQSVKNLEWTYELFNEETHESLAYTSLYQGLRFYYHNYSSKVFSGTKEFYDEGGLPGLQAYFKARSERFGMEPEIDASTKNSLIWLAWKQDDFSSFQLFMTKFKDVLSTPRYASAYWQNRFGQYYLKNNDAANAIEYFNNGIKQYPDPEYLTVMHAGLGNAYALVSNTSKARVHYKQAIKLAKANNNDEQRKDYEKQLKSLK
ncbi:alpha/beta hydrolase-fold protein [Ekhidna sp.]|uniref:alpha/beta hydrolase-fold protein n=1 Tax=Ekhidna sp. TaxID=2608089 RepID=UPI003B512066